MAQGGSFETGAITGAISAGASLAVQQTPLADVRGVEGKLARTFVAAAAGGTASVLSGGKFANGANTGTMGHLYNAESKPRPGIGHNGGPPLEVGSGGFGSSLGRFLGRLFGPIGVLIGSTKPAGPPFETIYDVLPNPQHFDGKTFEEMRAPLEGAASSGRWEIGTLRKGDHAGEGWVIREVLPNGEYSGSLIQWHPGSVRHYEGRPYWKISNSYDNSKTVRLPAFRE